MMTKSAKSKSVDEKVVSLAPRPRRKSAATGTEQISAPAETARTPAAKRTTGKSAGTKTPVAKPAGVKQKTARTGTKSASARAAAVNQPVSQPEDADHDQAQERALPVREGKPVNWDQRLGFLMHDVSRLRRIVFDGYMKPAGVTRSQWWVLAYLSRNDGIIQTDLATVLDIGKAALGGLIDRLEAAGFVERRPDSDRRAKRVYLLPSGKALIREMTAKSDRMSEEILCDLTRDERVRLADYLTRIKLRLLAIKGE